MRDCGGHPKLLHGLIQAMNDGLIEGPRLYHCAEVVTTTGGHGYTFGVEADGPEEVIRAVPGQFKNGASFVKLMATGGGTPNTFPGLAAFSVAELRAGVETAHRIDKKVAVHARGIPGMKNSMEAGVDFIEHACFELPDGGQKFDERLAGEMAEAGICVTPTIRLYRDVVERLTRLREGRGLSPAEEAGLGLMRAESGGETPGVGRVARGRGDHSGGGNDAGIPQTGFGRLWQELAIMTEGGMSPLEAIAAATLEPARALNLEDEMGSIRAGKRADLIAVSGDPTKDINRLGRGVMGDEGRNHYPELGIR